MKSVTLLDAGSCVECGRNMNRPKKNMTCGIMTCKMDDLETE